MLAAIDTPCEADPRIYQEFARAVFEVREVSQREVLLPTPRLDFVGIWICHVYLTRADFLLFDLSSGPWPARRDVAFHCVLKSDCVNRRFGIALFVLLVSMKLGSWVLTCLSRLRCKCTCHHFILPCSLARGTIRIGFVVDEELRSVDLELGPNKLRRSDALAYIANYAAIRRMAMVVTLNGETWRNQKENFGFYLREDQTFHNFGLAQQLCLLVLDYESLSGFVKESGSVSVSWKGPSLTASYSHSWMNSTARSESTASGTSSSKTENWNFAETQSKIHAEAVQLSKGNTESQGLAKAITEALQYSISKATAVSEGTNFRHMRAEALSDVVNTFFRDHISQFPRAVLTDDVKQCDLPWFERPAHRLNISSIEDVYGEVKPAELHFVEPAEMNKTIMPTGLLDWQYPAGDQLIRNQQTEPMMLYRMELTAESEELKEELKELRLLDIAFSISDISSERPRDGARYEIVIDSVSRGKFTLSAQDGQKMFDIKAFSHCRNFVDISAADVKEVQIQFTRKVVLMAVQVLVCATAAGRIAKNLQGEENLLMLKEEQPSGQ
eukprot:s2278_g11.t1